VLRFLKFAKVTVLASAVGTIFCATFIFGWQLISWFRHGSWDVFPISSVLLSGKAIYIIASADHIMPQQAPLQNVIDWLLEIPAIVPLAIASALLFSFYARLSMMEKQLRWALLRRGIFQRRDSRASCCRRCSANVFMAFAWPGSTNRLCDAEFSLEREDFVALRGRLSSGIAGEAFLLCGIV
jgi:hypothetical protein